MTWQPHGQWWQEQMDLQAAIEAVRQRAERAEADRDCTAAELQRLQRVYRALRAGVKLPFMNMFPVP